MRKLVLIVILLSALALLLAACGPSKAPAARAVEDYLNALVSKDENKLVALSCADWESSATLEFDSLQAVTSRLQGLNCSVSGKDGDTSLVECKGKLLATYNGEDQELDLSVRTYEVIQQGGNYLVCGYR